MSLLKTLELRDLYKLTAKLDNVIAQFSLFLNFKTLIKLISFKIIVDQAHIIFSKKLSPNYFSKKLDPNFRWKNEAHMILL